MKIYAAIDGTDNYDHSKFSKATPPGQIHSHVKRLALFGFDQALYIPGTTDTFLGRDTEAKGKRAAKWIQERLEEKGLLKSQRGSFGRRPGVFIAGFSRGGVSALVAAHELSNAGIPVDGLFLFDAVDRSPVDEKYTGRLPVGAVRAYHAFRATSSGSRNYFSTANDSFLMSAPPKLIAKGFHATHGAIGGWPQPKDSVKLVDTSPFPDKLQSTMGKMASNAFPMTKIALNLARGGHVVQKNRHLEPRVTEDLGLQIATNVAPSENKLAVTEVWNWMLGNLTEAVRAYEDLS